MTDSPKHAPDRNMIAAQLRLIGDWLDFTGDNSFRSRAYRAGADALEAAEDFDTLAAQQRLTELPGIGPSLAKHVDEILRTGASSYLVKLRGALPDGLVELPNAAHVSAAKIRLLHEQLGIRDYDDLVAAARDGRIAAIKGFGQKSVDKMLDALTRYKHRAPRMTLNDADERIEEMRAFLQVVDEKAPIEVVGARRRAEDTVDDISLAATLDEPERALARWANYPRAARIESRSDDAMTLRLLDGTAASLHVARPAHAAMLRWRATGPSAHVEAILARLVERGRSFDEAFADETAIYEAAGSAYVPPERRDTQDLNLEDHEDLIEQQDILGMTHCHTTYSDGTTTIEALARAAEARGFRYLTITDHSPSANYANGVELDRLRRQWDELAAVQERVTIRLLRGTESDITLDGSLDYPDKILEQLDVIIASVHVRHKLDRRAMTARIVRAMRHPLFKIWGHALGRLLLRREPFDCDLDEIFAAIAESNAAIELNSDPHRLDLPSELIPRARAYKIPFVISTDAHGIRGLDYLKYGIGAARRGGLRKRDVLNTLPIDEFIRAVKPLR